MKKFTLDTTVLVDIQGTEVELDVQVNFNVHGSYSPGTREDPPEYPDLEIEEISSMIFGTKVVIPESAVTNKLALGESCWDYYDAREADVLDDGPEEDEVRDPFEGARGHEEGSGS